METYTLEEIIEDIRANVDFNFDITRNNNTVYVYLQKYSDLYSYSLEYNEELKRIEKFLQESPKVPEGTYIPEGKELLLYELYNQNDIHEYKLYAARDLSTLDNMTDLLNLINTMEFKTNIAIYIDLKNHIFIGIEADNNQIN